MLILAEKTELADKKRARRLSTLKLRPVQVEHTDQKARRCFELVDKKMTGFRVDLC